MPEGRRIFMTKGQVDMQVGVGLPTGQGSDPVIMYRISRDAGYTWGNIQELPIGRQGEYQTRVMLWQLGEARQPVFEFSGSDPNVLGILDFWIEATPGSN